MVTEIRYRDGFVVDGGTEEEMVARAEAHVREAHAELASLITREQILVTVREARFVPRVNRDETPRVLGPCPFDLWELSLVYGL